MGDKLSGPSVDRAVFTQAKDFQKMIPWIEGILMGWFTSDTLGKSVLSSVPQADIPALAEQMLLPQLHAV